MKNVRYLPAISRVTITGADESVSPQALVDLSREFPFVEWAILLSSTKEGSPRFPNRSWIRELVSLRESCDLKLAGHICGDWVRKLVVEENPIVFEDRPEFIEYFPRIQLNFSTYDVASSFIRLLIPFSRNNEFILQVGEYKSSEKIALLPNFRNKGISASILFDRSGGKGIVPLSWPEPGIGYPVGYAGGLGPDTLVEQLPRITEVVGDYYSKHFSWIWIDMESRVRSNNDQQFDLDKVRACLEISRPWVAKQLFDAN